MTGKQLISIETRLKRARTARLKASARIGVAAQKLDLECRLFRQKRSVALSAAQKAATKAIAAVTALELEQAGIVPMETIVQYEGSLWAVRIKPSGYAELDPMTKHGRPHMGKYAISTPYRLSQLIITDMKVKP